MTNEKVFAMSFAKVYPMLIAKAERKGRTRDEVQKVTAWLTGYSREQLEELMVSDITYGDFFRNGSWSISILPAPAPAVFRSAPHVQTLTARAPGRGSTPG